MAVSHAEEVCLTYGPAEWGIHDVDGEFTFEQ